MEATTTTFDAIAFKRAAALRLHELLSKMTRDEELAFWQEKTRLLRERQRRLRAEAAGDTATDLAVQGPDLAGW